MIEIRQTGRSAFSYSKDSTITSKITIDLYASAAALKISPGTVLCFGHVPVEKASIHKSKAIHFPQNKKFQKQS